MVTKMATETGGTATEAIGTPEEWEVLCPDTSGIIERDRIFVANIPKELNEIGLKHIFERYGAIRDIRCPKTSTGKAYAFVQYNSFSAAECCLRRFREDNPNLPISVDYARPRQEKSSGIQYDFCETTSVTDDSPFRNVPELSNRNIKGPFANPSEGVIKCNSLIMPSDYMGPRKIGLKVADPRQEFLWNSYDEANIDCEIMNKKIVHGRAIFSSTDVDANDDGPLNTHDSEKKTFTFNSSLLPSIKRCVNCQRPADKYCKNCEDSYCSLKCHAVCLKKPTESTEEEQTPTVQLTSRISAKKIDQIVKITAVINHRVVFIRPATRNDDIEFARLLCDTVKYAKNADALKFKPSIGSLVLAKFDYYQRALVLKVVSETHVAVAFIDFGNIEIRPINELKVMPDILKKKNRFATKIQLNHIDHDIMNDEALKVLYHYMAQGTEMKFESGAYNQEKNITTGNLKTSDDWINQLVNKQNIKNIEPRIIGNINDRMLIESIPYKEFDYQKLAGKEVIILDNSQIELSDLAFIVADDLEQFRMNDRRIQNVCNYLYTKDVYYTPREFECCVVRLNERWYRAYCLEVCYDGFPLMAFIDYGCMQLIEICHIQPIPEILTFECITIADCFSDLENMKDNSTELKNQYPVLSRQTIERMEESIETNIFDEKSTTIKAWFQKKPHIRTSENKTN